MKYPEYILKYDKADAVQQAKMPYLDNKLGIIDLYEMLDAEYKVTSIKTLELYQSGKIYEIPMNYDGLAYIHKYLFDDLYPWAGKLRTNNISKEGNLFYVIDYLSSGIDGVFNSLKKDNYLKNLTKIEFVELLAYYSNELNVLHTFREGNGRVKRIFLTELARRAGYDIDLSKLDPKELRYADIEAFGSLTQNKPSNFLPLKLLFLKSITPIDKEIKQEKMPFYKMLNRVLWIYDREEYSNWQKINEGYFSAENKVKELLRTNQGREKLVTFLENAKLGSKPTFVVEWINKTIEQLFNHKNQNIAQDEHSL